MRTIVAKIVIAAACAVAAMQSASAQNEQIERGKYLVAIGGCTDCHTPGYFLGKPDMDRYLGGSEVGFEIPGLGVFYGSNLTPDKETGLGNWTDAQIIAAIRKGERPDGRELAPAMPWRGLDEDASAIVAYLRSIKPVQNKIPGPFGPDEKPGPFVMQVLPAGAFKPTPVPK